MSNQLQPPPNGYTVINQCCDPPTPVWIQHFTGPDAEQQALRAYNQMVVDSNAAGEFSIELWQHGPEPTCVTMETGPDHRFNPNIVYDLCYPNSTKLREFSYMDLGNDKDDEQPGEWD